MSHIEANHAVDPSDKDAIYTNNIELRQPFDAPDAQCAEFDARDMNRMGKKQEMRRHFEFFSIWGYAVILGNTWEYALVTSILSLPEGGPAGAIWMFLATCFGMFFVMLSMAEMASMAPTAGGQFHWVSEFALPQYQKILSYMVGWMATLGWQCAQMSTGLICAEQFIALIALANPNYVIEAWHTSLLTMAVTVVAIAINILLLQKLPLIENLVIGLHMAGFLAVFIVLWVMGERAPVRETWLEFQDNAGWGNTGLACLVGLSSPVVTLIGADSSCHLSEELNNAAWVLPRAMVATAITNYILGFLMTVALMSNLGNVTLALASRTGQPYVSVLQSATGSYAATCTLTAVVGVLLLAGAINQVTTSSRQLFAFARDSGLPFSPFLARVRPGAMIPLNAMLVTLVITVLLSLIVIASDTALTNIINLSLTGLVASYLVVIGCVLAKRLKGEAFPPSRFSLGRCGVVVNGLAIAFLVLTFLFMFFPADAEPSAASMNWSVLIFAVVVAFSVGYYFLEARKRYVGPVAYVRKDV